MKKIMSIVTAFAIVAIFAFTGCQKQERQGGPTPERTAPTATPAPSAPGAPGAPGGK